MKEVDKLENEQRKRKEKTFTEAEIMGEACDNGEAEMDSPDVPMRPSEKKRLQWKNLTCMFVCVLQGFLS